MPGMGMGFRMCQTQTMQMRQELALKLQMRLELRLELSLRQALHQQEYMSLLGVEDPMRVRIFKLDIPGEKKPLFVVGKQMIDPDEELANLVRFNELATENGIGGIPEILGVMDTGADKILITKFDKKAANAATLFNDPNTYEKFLKLNNIKSDPGEIYTAINNLLKKHEQDSEDSDNEGITLESILLDLINVFNANQQYLPDEFASKSQEEVIKFITTYTLPLELYPDYLRKEFMLIHKISLLHALGKEISLMHNSGIDKNDIFPRNIMVHIDKNGGFSFVHTGFRNIKFKETGLTKEEREKSLKDIFTNFPVEDPSDDEKNAFLSGYQEKNSLHASQTDKQTALNTDPNLIISGIHSRLEKIYKSQGYRLEKTKVDQEIKPIEEVIENIVLQATDEEISSGLIFKKINDYVSQTLSRDTMPIYEQRAADMLKYLFRTMYEQQEPVRLEVIETGDDEVRMHQSSAAKAIAPLIDKYKLLYPFNASKIVLESIVLREFFNNPQLTSQQFTEKIWIIISIKSEFNWKMDFSRRTFNKYLNKLQAKGKIPNIKVCKLNKIIKKLNKKLHQGEKISENLAEELNLKPEDMNLILKAFRNMTVNQKLGEIINGGNVDLYELSEQLDISYPELTEKLHKLRGGQNNIPENEEIEQNAAQEPESIQAETNHEAERVIEEENYEEMIIEQNDENVEEQITATETQTHVQTQPPVQEQLPVQEPEPATTNQTTDRIPQALIENYAELIIQNPANRYENIQQHLGVPFEILIQAEQILAEQNSIEQCRNNVLDLIRTIPGIDDPELMRRTGLTILQIHLIVRPLLLNSQLHSGRPN